MGFDSISLDSLDDRVEIECADGTQIDGEFALALLRGASVQSALASSTREDRAPDVTGVFARLLDAGAFTHLFN